MASNLKPLAFDPKQLKADLANWAQEYELVGASVVLFAKGEPIVQEYLGHARVEDSVETTASSTYRIASISKTLSTLAVLKLVEAGKVDLEQDINTYLDWELINPAFPSEKITLAHILGHRSGIRDGKGYSNFLAEMRRGGIVIRELFTKNGKHFTQDMFAAYKPDEYFSYSNASWGIVAAVVEKVSGQRFDRFCKEQLFEPMGMQASFNILDIPIEQVATLYRANKGSWNPQADDVLNNAPTERAPANYILGSNGLVYGPQGSLRASTSDMIQVAKLLMGNGEVDGTQIFKPETLALLSEDKWVYDGNNGDTWSDFWMSYGKGLQFIVNTDSADIIFSDRTMMGHPGIAYGLLSDMYVDPETQSGVIFITNGSKQAFGYGPTTSFYGVEEALFKILYPILLVTEAQ
jgi:CubicO group peptidase (beta-lactamase class C family)